MKTEQIIAEMTEALGEPTTVYGAAMKHGRTAPMESTWVSCAICHNSHVTLLKREGAYVCRPCYQKLLTLRALEKQQQKERAEI